MAIYESGENYLETILLLQRRNGFVRATDIARELGYSKPSISRAMGILKRAGYITVGEEGGIVFTDEGLAKAKAVYERHSVIMRYLTEELNVSEETASEDACRIEHVISEETFEKMCARLK